MKRKYDDIILLDESGVNTKRYISKKVLCKDEFCIIVSYLNYMDIRHFDIIFKDHEYLEIIKNRRESCIENLYKRIPTICKNFIEDDLNIPCKEIKVIAKNSDYYLMFEKRPGCKCGGEYIINTTFYKGNHYLINNREDMIRAMKINYFSSRNVKKKMHSEYMDETRFEEIKSRRKTLFNYKLMVNDLFDFCGFISSNITVIRYLTSFNHTDIPNFKLFDDIGLFMSVDEIEKMYNKYLHPDVVKERLELKK